MQNPRLGDSMLLGENEQLSFTWRENSHLGFVPPSPAQCACPVPTGKQQATEEMHTYPAIRGGRNSGTWLELRHLREVLPHPSLTCDPFWG